MPTPQTLLSLGLTKGFAGETQFQTIQRAGFTLHSSHLEVADGTYHDEWAADRTGGGQELVKVGETTFTRVYAGGTISLAALEQLGITKEIVVAFLIASLTKAGEATRLSENYGPIQDGDWSYQYQVIEKNQAIPLTVGKENITYKDQLVFTHVFVMCPVE
jgi:hypothetical protein